MRHGLPRGARLSVAAALAALTVIPAQPAAAQSSPAASSASANPVPIGGAVLGSTGVVTDRTPKAPKPPAVTAEGWLVADVDSGDVLGARNAHGKFLPASTLKTLTAIALLPRLSPTTMVKPTQAAANIDGTKVGIRPGYPISVDMLFTGMLIYSGNDTATALADAAGGQAKAVRLMNEQAKRLQAGDTLAVNTTGLDATGQFSSPYDLALMGRAALKIPAFVRYTGIRNAKVPSPTGSFEIANKNRLLYTYDGAFGGKTGGTTKALQTYIGFAQRGSRRLVVTIMKTRQWQAEATKLLDWGFAAAGVATPVGVLVPALDEVRASSSASVAEVVTAGGTAPTSEAAASAGPTEPVDRKLPAAATPAAGKKRKGLADRLLPDVDVTWRQWYAAPPAGFVALVIIALGLRRRRRRRYGFYLPQTKLKLPIR